MDLNLIDPATSADVDGQLTTQGADTRKWVDLLALELPEGISADELGKINLSTRFKGALGGQLSFNTLSAELPDLGVTAKGDMVQQASGKMAGTLALSNINLTQLAEKLPGLVAADTFSGNAPNDPLLTDPTGSFNWDGERLTLSNTRGTALGVPFTADASITDRLTKAQITLAEFSPKQALTYFTEPVETTNPTALTQASGRFELNQTSTETSLQQLTATLDQSNLSGWLTHKTATLPTLRFDLSLDALNVADYLPPEATTENPATTNGATNGAASNEALLGELVLPTEPLHAWDLAGKLQIGVLQMFDLRLGNVRTEMALGNGRGALRGLSLGLYEGTLAGDIEFSQLGSDAPELAIKSTLSDISIGELLIALADTANFTGKGSVGIDLSGRGRTVLEATQSAAGSFELNLTNGTFTGVNLGRTLCRLYNQVRSQPLPPDPDSNATSFDSFSASAIVSAGEATTNDLRTSNSYLQLTAKAVRGWRANPSNMTSTLS